MVVFNDLPPPSTFPEGLNDYFRSFSLDILVALRGIKVFLIHPEKRHKEMLRGPKINQYFSHRLYITPFLSYICQMPKEAICDLRLSHTLNFPVFYFYYSSVSAACPVPVKTRHQKN
jgi:hypothetical protein